MIKIISIGGGGYSLSAVARCWTAETAVAIGIDLDEEIPDNKYYIFYAHENLNVQSVPSIKDSNNNSAIHNLLQTVCDNLSNVEIAPSV